MRIIRWLPAAALTLTALVAAAGPASAAVAAVGQETGTETVGSTLTVSATLVTIVLGIVAPLVTGAIVRPTNPTWVKILLAGVVGIVLNALQQAVRADGSAVLSGPWLLQLALLLAAEFGTYHQIWQPLAGGDLNARYGRGAINVTSRRAA